MAPKPKEELTKKERRQRRQRRRRRRERREARAARRAAGEEAVEADTEGEDSGVEDTDAELSAGEGDEEEVVDAPEQAVEAAEAPVAEATEGSDEEVELSEGEDENTPVIASNADNATIEVDPVLKSEVPADSFVVGDYSVELDNGQDKRFMQVLQDPEGKCHFGQRRKVGDDEGKAYMVKDTNLAKAVKNLNVNFQKRTGINWEDRKTAEVAEGMYKPVA